MNIELTVFQGRAGDRNDLAIPGAKSLATLLGQHFGMVASAVGIPEPALGIGWKPELELALPALQALQGRFEQVYARGKRSVAATSRCAVSLATLPIVARHRPDACVVWFDAHADLNTPASSLSGYLGGLALSGPLGLWNSGLGNGLSVENVVLVGQRDIDPFEAELMQSRRIHHVRPGDGLSSRLLKAIGGRPVYMHLDCDVLNPGIVPTEYVHEGGLSLADLHAACEAMAQSEVIGVEIAEFQNSWTVDGEPVSPTPLIEALRPVLEKIRD